MKLKLTKYFLVISILSLISLFVFIVQSGYSKIKNQQAIQDEAASYSNIIIDAKVDLSVIEKIKKKQEFNYQQPTSTPQPDNENIIN